MHFRHHLAVAMLSSRAPTSMTRTRCCTSSREALEMRSEPARSTRDSVPSRAGRLSSLPASSVGPGVPSVRREAARSHPL